MKNLWDEVDVSVPLPACDYSESAPYVEHLKSQCLLRIKAMPKVKRFKNPLKVANGRASSSTTPAAQALPDASTIPSQAHEEQAPILLQEEQASIPPQQEQVHVLPSNSSVPLMNKHIYSKYWNVDTRDSENAIKQIHVRANEVNNLTVGERIIVKFDDYNTTYGEAQGLLAGYCGSLAIDCNLFLISFERWSGPLGIPKKYMEDCFKTILKFLETGKTPSRAKMFIETHKRRNGSFVNDEARTIGKQIVLNMTQGDTNETEVSPNDTIGKMLGAEHSGRVRCMGMVASPSNTFLNTKRRFSELSISSSSYGVSSTNSTYLHQKVAHLESQLEGTLTALKDYMISKDGGVPEQFSTLFSPQSEPADSENDPVSLVDIRGSSIDNNTNQQSTA
ncbi:hypothetical protein KY289_035961 [Solanum tuberosum]|nr:hypothetical protein KY289_035961 [Solanum tuberosum]